MELNEKQKQNFWAKVNMQGKDECWEWLAGTAKGYGSISFNGKHYRANRIAWMLANGRMPLPHLDICHSCDNPRCCNPSHLWEGTRQQNLKDAANKGRIHSWKQKLTADQVRMIRGMRGRRKDIADRFGIHPATVSKIVNRSVWTTLD